MQIEQQKPRNTLRNGLLRVSAIALITASAGSCGHNCINRNERDKYFDEGARQEAKASGRDYIEPKNHIWESSKRCYTKEEALKEGESVESKILSIIVEKSKAASQAQQIPPQQSKIQIIIPEKQKVESPEQHIQRKTRTGSRKREKRHTFESNAYRAKNRRGELLEERPMQQKAHPMEMGQHKGACPAEKPRNYVPMPPCAHSDPRVYAYWRMNHEQSSTAPAHATHAHVQFSREVPRPPEVVHKKGFWSKIIGVFKRPKLDKNQYVNRSASRGSAWADLDEYLRMEGK